jgi:AcrR family transcriptional regulator
MQPKEKTKGETTRTAIEDATIELIMEQGYHATSMRQIAERADLALGGIYNHFASKEEIFEAIIVDKHPYKKILPLILEAQGETAEDFLKSAVQIAITELSSHPYYIKLMLIELVEFNGKHGAGLMKELLPKVLPIFEKVIKTRKSLRVTNPLLLMRSFIGSVISYILTDMILTNSMLKNLMPKNAKEVHVNIYLHGILKDQG